MILLAKTAESCAVDVTDLIAVSIYLSSNNFGVALHAGLTIGKYCYSLSG